MKVPKVGPLSRRSMLKGSLIVIAAGMTGHAAAQQKIDRKLVQYQETPKNGQKCSDCLQFTPPDGCKVVEGKISPNAWCAVFVAKPKS